MARRLVLVVGGLILAAAAFSVYVLGRDREPSEPQAAATSPSMTGVVAELSAFVERSRGLEFQREVKVSVLPADRFAGELAKLAPDPIQAARTDAVLTVVGLLPDQTELGTLMAAADRGRHAFYDAAREELFVAGEPTPFVRGVLVHELTHALDDQHFGIDRRIQSEDAALAFSALVEGSAIRIERQYVASLPEPQRREAAEHGEAIGNELPLPPGLEELVRFPLLYGLPLVEALAHEGRLDEAFASPPLSTEQVIDPARYASGDAPRVVERPRTEGATLDEGEFGPVALRLLLESRLDRELAGRAATGWDGDRYATWRSPDGRTCIRVAFAADTPEDARELEAALAAWVDRVTDREVDSAGLLLKACGLPGRP